MVSGYFGNLEPNLQWYFSDVLPGGTFRVSHGPGRGHRPQSSEPRAAEQGWGKGNEPVYLISRSCLRCSLCTIIHSHYILTYHHHPTYYKSSQKTGKKQRRGKRPTIRARTWWHGERGEEENDIHWTGDNIFLNFWNNFHRASGIIDKHYKTLSLNKLFWDKKPLGNIATGTISSFNSFSVYFRKKLQVWNCERRTHVQSPKSTLFKVSRMFADEYLLFIPPAIPCSLISGDDWTILSGLWRLKYLRLPLLLPAAAGDGQIPGAREIPLSDPQRGSWLTQTCLLGGVSRWWDRANNSQSSANNIPRGIIYYNPVQWEQISLIHILFRITTKHDYTASQSMLLPPSPRQITIRDRSMLDMSRHSDGVTSPGVVSLTPVSVCRWPQLNNFIPTRNLLHNPSPLKRI